MSPFIQGFGTSGIHRIQPVGWDHAQDLNHLAVAVRHLTKLALHTPDCWRQFPVLKGRTIPERARFSSQDRDVMQRLVNRLVAAEGSVVLPHKLTVLPELDSLGISTDLNWATDGSTIHRVAVLIEPNEAGFGHRGRQGVEAIEGADIRHQAGSFLLEHLPSCSIPELGVRVGLSPGNAPVFKPSVQFGIAFKLRSRHEEPPPDNADLVLDLSLLPARGGGAGDRIDQVMSAHLLEPAIIGAVATDKDRIHRRLHVVVNPPSTGSAEEGKSFIVGVKDHLRSPFPL